MGNGLRSSINSTMDFGRLANAVSRPGIDPRVWVSYATLTSDPVVDTVTEDGSAGVFVELMLMPSGNTETARVGAMYAGNGFGLYAPLKKDDEVLVCAPSGDPDEGLVVMQRLWSAADPPPAAAATYPNDVTLVVESGRSLRVGVAGAGRVLLGDVAAAQAAMRGTAYRAAEDSLFTALTALEAAIGAFIASPAVAALAPPLAGTVATALAAYTNAKVAFDSQAATYLSQKVVLE